MAKDWNVKFGSRSDFQKPPFYAFENFGFTLNYRF